MPTIEADPPVIETPDLILRLACRADIPEFQPYVALAEVSRFTSRIPHPYTLSDAEDYIRMVEEIWDDSGALHCMIRRKSDSALIGMIALEPDGAPTVGEIGYWIAPPFWGQGYVGKAAQAMMRYGFEQAGFKEIRARVVAENSASLRVMEKLGLRGTGEAILYFPARDRNHLVRLFALTREEWEAKSA